MQAYHGKQEIKDKYVARMRAHIEADELVRGIGFEEGKGCAVGCTLNHYAHADYETELGVPEWLARVEDTLFEGMNLERSKTFPLIFLQTIRPGMDLDSIKKPFLIYILQDVLTYFDNAKYPAVTKVIHQVITLHKTVFESEAAEEAAEEAAREAAMAAAETVAWSAAEVAARAAAETVAWSAAEAAGGVAWAAAWAAGRSRGAAAGAVWAAAEAGGAAEAAEGVAWAVESPWVAAGTPARGAAYVAAVAEAAWAARAAYDKYADKLLELIGNGGEECKHTMANKR